MTTRYHSPYIPDAVKRQRLFRVLDENFHHQNFLITGQAAQGKSTLVASYLQQSDKPRLWFHLLEDDADYTKLSDKIVRGMQELSGKNRGKINLSIPGTTLGTEKGVLRHIEGVSILFQALIDPLVIVLDDFESLDENSSGFQFIKGIVSSRFDKLKFFILSRSIPQFNIPRLKMEHNIFMLNNDDLAFTLDETRQFFTGYDHVKPIDIKKIQQVTDGWAGGLTLVLESLRQFKTLRNLPDRLSSEVFDYFSHEIYKNIPDHIRKFLMKTSILDIIDPEIVNHIFGPWDTMEILTGLEKRNLFIQRIDSDNQLPKFKYHTLFRDFLFQDFLKTQGRKSCKSINRKAGKFFWEKKDHEQALKYFSRADAFSDIVSIIKIKGTDYVVNGKMSALEKWITRLPEEMIQKDPWLIFFLTMTRRIKGGKKNIKNFQKALVLFEQRGDIRGILLSAAYLIEAAVFIRQPSWMILEWIEKGEEQLKRVSQKNRYPWARASLWQKMGLGYIAGDGNIPKGVSACRNAILLGRQINNKDLVLNASITQTFGYVQAGDFVNARQMLSKIKNITKEGQHPEYRALKGIVDIDFALKNNGLDVAGRLLNKSEQDIEKFGLIFLYPGFVESKALYLIYTKQFDEAQQMADHLNDFSILEGNNFYKGISHRIKALSFLQEKKFKRADIQIQKALKELDPAQKGDIHHFLARQLAGMIFLENRNFLKAKNMMIPALEYFQRISSDLSCSEVCFALGLISWELKEKNAAYRYLTRGIETAFQEGYVFFPLVSKDILTRAVLLMIAYDKAQRVKAYAVSLILQCDPALVFEQMDRILSDCKQKEKPRIIENLRDVYKKFLPGIRIKTLGTFSVLAGNKVLDNKKFEGARPLLLLKAIVLHGSKDIPKEILIDDLWPKAASKAGNKNFKINLHRLRKAIEPHPKKEFGYSYIIQKSGLISLDPELVSLDVDEFIAFVEKAEKNERNNKFETALEFYNQALKIYRGDYFSEEPYLGWISIKRDFFRSRYIDLLQKKAMLHEELDQIDKAVETWQLILGADPYFEAAYQNLMILYVDSGQKNRAMAVFQECCSLFGEELGIEPDAQTFNIYNTIKLK